MKKKVGLKFALSLIFFAFIGALCSIIMRTTEQEFNNIIANLSYTVTKNSAILMLIGVIPLIIGSVLVTKVKKVIKSNDNLDEDEFEKVQKMISLSLFIPSVIMPWGFMCFGFSAVRNIADKTPYILLDLLIFVIEAAWITIIQYQAVEQTKKISPEKKGNVLDKRFEKDWYSSCDEAEKQIIGEACYVSYRTMNRVYPVLFAVMICICGIYNLSPIIFFVVGLLWSVQIFSYLIPSYKLEHGKKSRR